jgi:hypothetical protein
MTLAADAYVAIRRHFEVASLLDAFVELWHKTSKGAALAARPVIER